MKIYVKPLEEFVGTPGDFGLPADGAWVPRSSDNLTLSFWLRRVRAGDVTKHEGPPKPKKKRADGAAGGDTANSATGAKGDS